MNLITEYKAFDKERGKVADVLSIIFDTTDENYGSCRLRFGSIRYAKNHLKDECILLPFTNYYDKKKDKLYLDDLLKDEKGTIFRITWNTNQTQFWLTPVKVIPTKVGEESDTILEYAFNTQSLGNGYFRRDDLKRIGNYHVDKEKFKLSEGKAI